MHPLIEKYGERLGGKGTLGEHRFTLAGGRIYVRHPEGRHEVPGPVGLEIAKGHEHYPVLQQLLHRPEHWHVGEQEFPIVQHHGASNLARMAWGEPGDQIGIKGDMTSGFSLRSNRGKKDVSLHFDPNEKSVHISTVIAPGERPKGWGGSMFLRHLTSSRSQGYQHFHVPNASGDRTGWNGHYFWPRLGFNGEVPLSYRRDLPDDLHKHETFHELFDDPNGPEIWKHYGGDSTGLYFNARNGSPYMERLLKYLKGRHRG